ncbi:MAG: pitrilysin family protein [Pirellulales bacterium]
MLRNVRAWVLVMSTLGSIGIAQEPTKVTTVEGVTEYRLANGARVLLFPEASRPTITVNMTVLVGSRHEGYGEAGMAHLLEHLVFKGTPTFRDVPKALRDHGANFNGTTNVDRTNYFETLPSSDENLEFAIQLESDRLVNSFIDREDLMSEFTVVRNEFERGENSPQGILSQRVQSAAYEWHNYGKSTIGNRSDIERVPIDNLQAFYRKFYQPDNVVFIITGRFDEAKALGLVQKYLGSIPKPARKLDKTYTEEPPQDGERNVVLRRVGSIGSVAVAYHMPASAHPDWAPLSILASVLSENKVGRLDQVLVETKMATSASANADSSHDPGLFFFSAQPSEGKLEEVSQTLVQLIETMSEKPFGAEEVERAKRRAQRGSEQLFSSAAGVSQALSSASSLGDWRLLFLNRDRVQAVTVDDVNRVAGTYFKKHNRTLGLFIPVTEPQRLSVPAVESIADVVKDYQGSKKVVEGEAFDPTPENLDSRTKVVNFDGIRVGLLPKKNRGETVSLVLTLHYGNEESLQGKSTAAGMLSGMMMQGTAKHDKQALQETMDKLGVRISGGAGGGGRRGGRGGGGGGGGRAGQLTFSVEAKRESLADGIRLLGEILREPSFPQDEFEQMKLRSLAGLSMMDTDPNMLATTVMSQALSDYRQGDVRYAPSLAESKQMLESVTLDEVKAIYQEQVSAAKGEIAIVGDFDPDQALEVLKPILSKWSSKVPQSQIEREAKKELTGAKQDIVTPDKANAVFLAGLSFPLDEDHPDGPALRLGNFILGGGTLSSRLGDRIRQQEGLSYGVSSAISIPSRGNDARFTINAITNPVNMQAVEKAAFEELTRFIEGGPTSEELADAKKAFLEASKVARTGDAGIASQIVSNLNLDRTFAFTAQQEKMIAKLTVSDIKAAFQKHINPKKLVVIRAGDFRK